jgi:amino acid adenylation domain-containing protein
VALRFAGKDISFSELNARANRIARYLRELGVGPDDIVGIMLDRSIDMIVGLLAVLKAGGAYLPLDPEHPAQRQMFVLQDAGVSVLLTHQKWAGALSAFEGTCFCLDDGEALLAQNSAFNLDTTAQPSDLAYVIYTSGSTGQPKGCMISHAAICNRLLWMQDRYGLSASDRILQKTPYTFDVSVWELFLPLLSGARLVIAKPGGHLDNGYLVDLIQRERITVCHFVPSMLRFFLRQVRASDCVSLRDVFTSGEALSLELVKAFKAVLPETKLHNLYGPTEAAVDVTYWECEDRDDGKVPIGRAIDNIAIRILDAERCSVAAGEKGELYISGVGVGRGYLNRPALTAERFVDDPFGPAGSKMYRSGDQARLLPDGNIEFLGRIDFQVKLRGLRIELGEIEAILQQHSAVNDAVVVVKEEQTIDPKLVAYVAGSAGSLDIQDLRKFLLARLPKHMVPNAFVPMEALPVTAHGKLDRAALPWRAGGQTKVPSDPVPASTEVRRRQVVDHACRWTATALSIPRVADTDNLFDLGATSLTLLQLVDEIAVNYGVSIPVEVILDDPTIAAMVRCLEVEAPASVRNNIGRSEDQSVQRRCELPVDREVARVKISIRQIVTETLLVQALDGHENLFDLGATSLTLLQIVDKVAACHGVTVPIESILDSPTLTAISAYVETAWMKSSRGEADYAHPSEERGREADEPSGLEPIPLDDVPFQRSLYSRYAAARRLLESSIDLSTLGRFISVLAQREIDGQRCFLYPTAGDLAAVQTYIYVKPDRVRGLSPGIYYYHPLRHALVLINETSALSTDVFAESDCSIVDSGSFLIFLIGEMAAIEPIYKDASQSLLEVEAGYISQLLLNRQAEFMLGLAPLVCADGEALESACRLSESQFFICALAGGMSDAGSLGVPTKSSQTVRGGRLPAFKPSRGLRWSSGQSLNQQLIEQLHREERHLRPLPPDASFVGLDRHSIDKADFRARRSKRTYEAAPIDYRQLSKLLSIFRPRIDETVPPHLYAELCAANSIDILLYVKASRVAGLRGGLYRYDPVRHSLLWLRDVESDELECCFTPFNRRHYKLSAFCLFLLAGEQSGLPGGLADNLGRRQAGHIGQVLLERQAEMSLGLCPIGGLRPKRWQSVLGLDEGAQLLHNFVGGRYEQPVPARRELLELRSNARAPADHAMPDVRNVHSVAVDDLAIVGMSGRYPGAPTLGEFWKNLHDGVVSFRPIPASRFDGQQGAAADQLEHIRGGFLDDIDSFDSLLFNISWMEARTLDPQERLLLEATWECLEDAGYQARSLRQRGDTVGAFVGAMWNDYQGYGFEHAAAGKPIQAISVPSSLANRLSHYFDLNGPSVTFNTSCASAMTALHFACEGIRAGSCNVALVGGVNLVAHPHHLKVLDQLSFLSKDSTARPFGAAANGWVIGEGLGVLMIKRRSDAERDRDHIYGFVKGTSLGHSGLTFQFGAPDIAARTQSIKAALTAAGATADSISYIETAVSGTGISDAAEVSAIKAIFEPTKRSGSQRYLGSLKGNIGHLESASAMSQIAKVLLQFRHRTITPTLGCLPASSLINLDSTGLSVADRNIRWSPRPGDWPAEPLRALVNVFGATGTSGHVVLEECLNPADSTEQKDRRVIVPLSAASEEQLTELTSRLLNHLQTDIGARLSIADIGFTLRGGRVSMRERVVFIVESVQELVEKLHMHLGARAVRDGYYRAAATAAGTDLSVGGDMHRAANDWVHGRLASWEGFDEGHERRVSLPCYPFARVRHWIMQGGQAKPSIAPIGDDGKRKIEEYLVSTFSQVSEIPRAKIDPTAALELYGINSLMVYRLNARLDQEIGQISKTLFFEHRTLRDLAEYLAENHRHRLSRIAGLGDDKEVAHKLMLRSVSKAGVEAARPNPVEYDSSDIAIVGLAGRYPQAATIGEFWNNLKDGKDCITEIPKQRWDHAQYFSAERGQAGKTYSKWGGFIDGIDEFDPLFFRISPREAQYMDPQERLFLQVAHQTLEDAGYTRTTIRDRWQGNVGVFVGVMYGEYQLLNGFSSYGSIANRVSYSFDLHGPSMALDTMCSSSLTAVHLAVQSIQRGECRAAIAGGVNLSLHPAKYLIQAQLTMLSSDGRCRSFGEGGDGMTPGEGVGAILLKPLSQAISDHDHIYGVVKGTSVNHGGKTNGYTVPNPSAQATLVAGALRAANVDPRTISYIEAHGTGTSLGDPIEIAGLTQAFGQQADGARLEGQHCAIGSVKSNIGHLESAAGIAGITKVLLQMKHRTLVPSLHAGALNPQIDFSATPFAVQQVLSDWARPEVEIEGSRQEFPRTAGISSFGAGGANAHVIIQEYDPRQNETLPASGSVADHPGLIVLSARNQDGLVEQAKQLLAHVSSSSPGDADLLNIAYTLQVGREAMEHRLAFAAATIEEMAMKLANYCEARATNDDVGGCYQGEVRKCKEALSILNDDDAFRATIDKWIVQGQYDKLLELWAKGLNLDWERMYGEDTIFAGTKHQRVSLPTYPFARDRYWIEPGPRLSEAEASAQSLPVHLSGTDNRTPRMLHKQWVLSRAEPRPRAAQNYLIVVNAETGELGRKLAGRLPGSRLLWTVKSAAIGQLDIDWRKYQGWVDLAGCGRITSHDVEWIPLLQKWVDTCPADSIALGVTRGLEAFDNSTINLSGADRAGLYRMLSSEYTRLRALHLDVDAHLDDGALVDCIVSELSQYCENVEICYRSGQRYAARLGELEMPGKVAGADPLIFAPDQVLLVTGGTRGIGLLCAQHWVRHHGVRRLVLTSREGLPPREQWVLQRSRDDDVSRKIRAVEALQASGAQVEVLATPGTDELAMRGKINEITRKIGRVGGVIHCAGIVDGQNPAFVHKSTANIETVLLPKMAGLDHLIACLSGEPLRFVVLFSSISATIPRLAVGLSDYALANAYMDYVAHAHSATLPIVSIQWPNWQESGMGEVKTPTYRQAGFLSLTDAEGLRYLDQIVAAKAGSVVLPAVVDPSCWRPEEFMRYGGPQADSAKRELPAKRGSESLVPWLISLAARELGIPAADIDKDTPLHEYGADSIMLVRMLRPISERVGSTLDPSVLLEHPTISSFSQWLSSNHGGLSASFGEPLAASAPTEATDVPREMSSVAADTSLADKAEPRPAGQTSATDIAVVGISCRFPGANTVDEFWRLLAEGRSAIRAVPHGRRGRSNGYYAGLLDDVTHFDPAFFKLSQRDARAMDPQALLALEEALKVWSHAGYTPKEVKGQAIGVYLGARGQHRPDEATLRAAHNPIVAVGHNYLASNISRFFDLRGPSLVVDTACSSALVAMNMAVQAMRCGEIASALVGGVSVLDTDGAFKIFEQRGILNREAQFHLFDGRSNGAILAEGVGMVWLKPIEQALKDGDTIYALIKATAVNNDGRTASPTAPNFQAQREVMRTALARSGKRPDEISYVEVNGSGSEVTDLLELKAIQAEYRAALSTPCELGSMKPNIGHPLCAEGIASFIKVVLMLHHRTSVPFLSAKHPMTYYDFTKSPFRFSRQLVPWDGSVTTAAINCFADGGTNAHIILESYVREPTAHPLRTSRPSPNLKKVDVSARLPGPSSGLLAGLWSFDTVTSVPVPSAPVESTGLAFWESFDGSYDASRSVTRSRNINH